LDVRQRDVHDRRVEALHDAGADDRRGNQAAICGLRGGLCRGRRLPSGGGGSTALHWGATGRRCFRRRLQSTHSRFCVSPSAVFRNLAIEPQEVHGYEDALYHEPPAGSELSSDHATQRTNRIFTEASLIFTTPGDVIPEPYSADREVRSCGDVGRAGQTRADSRRGSSIAPVQAMIKSGTISVPFVSGPNISATAKLNAPTQVPTIIGIAKPRS
jgi:hypothetical protein